MDPETRGAPGVEVVPVRTDDDAARWRAAFSAGFGVTDPVAVRVSDEFARADHRIAGSGQCLALVGGEVQGCGSVNVVDGVGWLGAASTMPHARGRGVQAAMVRHRLEHARHAGADLAAATAVPTGASARNLVRLGFQLVQHQLVVAAPAPG